MMTEFRPVSCDTHEPLQFDPGFINNTIYGDKAETGWAWFPYKQNTDNFWLPVNLLSLLLKTGRHVFSHRLLAQSQETGLRMHAEEWGCCRGLT